jgi:pimeloyl-ACP methyl ester carboxylesterase
MILMGIHVDRYNLITEANFSDVANPRAELEIWSKEPLIQADVQAAAPYEAVVVEIVYKAIKLMLACAIILGSSGGAWLGLTLGSMFPQRVAAGLFVSSYGQKLSRTQITAQERPHAWCPAGTVWTEGPEPYLVPARGLSDAWRNAIGYVLQ